MVQTQTAYLARPGFPGLIEVQEQKELKNQTLFVKEVLLKFDPSLVKLLKFIGLGSILKYSSESKLVLDTKTILMERLL
jgi:hypothetical protein